MKIKYYKRYIDPNFDPTSATSSSTQNTSNDTSNTSTNDSTHSSSHSSSHDHSSHDHSSHSHSHSSSDRRTPSTPTLGQILWFLGQLMVIFCGIGYILPFMDPLFSFACYRLVFLFSILNYGFLLFKTIGFPQLNKEYFSGVMTNENAHYLLLSLILLTSYPLFTVLIPYVVYSVFHVSNFLKYSSVSVLPSVLYSFYRRNLEKYIDRLLTFQQQVLYQIAYFELTSILLIILNLFGGYGSFLQLFGYYWFLNNRYLSSSYARVVYDETGRKLDSFFLKAPGFIQSIYFSVRGFLRNAVQRREN